MGTLLGWLLIISCSDRAIDSSEPGVDPQPVSPLQIEPVIDEGEVLSEQLGDCDQVAPIHPYQFVCVNSEGAWLMDETAEGPSFIGTHAVAAAGRTDIGVILALDGQPYRLLDGSIDALSWSVPVPIETLSNQDGTLWMAGAGRLFRLVDEVVKEVSLVEHDTIYDFAASGERLHLAVPHLVTLDISGDTPAVLSIWDTPLDAMAVSEEGDLWVISDQQLYRKHGDDEPIVVVLPEPALDVSGPTIWVEGDTNTYRIQDGAGLQVPIVSTGGVSSDDYGRLLQVREGQLRRHSVGRPVVVVGLSESLVLSENITLLPTDPATLDGLMAWVDDVQMPLQVDPFQLTIDPGDFEVGAHQLRFFTESVKGDHISIEPFWVGELEDVEWPEVEALSDQHCARCHGGATRTDLSTAAYWELYIDRIIDLVSAQEMPPDDAPNLTDEEILTIRAWKQGGFQ